MTSETRCSGNLPLFFLVSWVRSAGAFLRASAAGPAPLPSWPWHTAQYVVNISFPEEGEVEVTGTFLMVFAGLWPHSAPMPADAITRAAMRKRMGTPFDTRVVQCIPGATPQIIDLSNGSVSF